MPASIPVEQEVADLLHAVNRRLRAANAARLEPLGITPAQARALRGITRAGGSVRMADLADQLHIARRSATSVVDDLAARQLVLRRDDPLDRRGVIVELTDDGVTLMTAVEILRRETASQLIGTLPRDSRTQLRDLLRSISE